VNVKFDDCTEKWVAFDTVRLVRCVVCVCDVVLEASFLDVPAVDA
jgi:hypothetical protein